MDQDRVSGSSFSKPEWATATERYECTQNGFGQWWPRLHIKSEYGGWYEAIIRDTKPFKNLANAIKFVEKIIAWRAEKRKH